MAAAGYALAGQIAKAKYYMARMLKLNPTSRLKLRASYPFVERQMPHGTMDGLGKPVWPSKYYA
jgi:hypothetical protein